jgi:GTP-binding protein Era
MLGDGRVVVGGGQQASGASCPGGVVDGDSHRESHAGFVAIAGRPNVGKSTLLNQIVGCKLAIVTPKPQTTRRRLVAIKNLPGGQILLVDTPGIHRARDVLNERLVDEARNAAAEADVVLWLVDASEPLQEADRDIARSLGSIGRPVVVALNKTDRIGRGALLPLMQTLAEMLPGAQPIPVSALTGENVEVLLERLLAALPCSPPLYPEGELTTATEREIVAEIVREKIMLETREEVPYSVAVTVDSFEEKPDKNLVVIDATIHLDRESHKPIVIGRGGARLKTIGRASRQEIERLLGRRVFLQLFVRVQPGWTREPKRFRDLGV